MAITALVGSQLKKWPALYHVVASTYFALKPSHLMELVVGTKAREMDWSTRHLRKGSDWEGGEDDEWVQGYWNSISHSHRAFLLEKVSAFYPFRNLLEIGCNCGPNLCLIAKKFPKVKIAGIDINPKAIGKGKQLFASEGISNVSMSVGKADRLEHFPDNSFDIVFTDAVLIYIGPDKIKKVLQEMMRVTRRSLLLLERFEVNGKDPQGLGIYSQGLWIRDYVRLLKQFVPEDKINVTRLPEGVWPDWEGLGAVIEVSMS